MLILLLGNNIYAAKKRIEKIGKNCCRLFEQETPKNIIWKVRQMEFYFAGVICQTIIFLKQKIGLE